MPIPGLRPQWEVVAKVRVGEKVMRGGRELPSSTDHFVCDDDGFNDVVGGNAKQIPIFLPDPNESFTSGLEWWQGQMLACYSKGDKRGDDYEAYRLPTMKKGGRTVDLLAGARVLTDEKKGRERAIIACPVRDCPYLKAKDCRPKGRLRFWIDGIDRNRGVYQFETQSWNTIEKIEGTLGRFPDPRGVPFLLTVNMVSNAKSRYPVVSLEAQMAPPETPRIATAATPDWTEDEIARGREWANLLVQAGNLLDADGNLRRDKDELEAKLMLTMLLDFKFPGWRSNADSRNKIVERINAVGVVPAMAKMVTEGLTS
jgi:Recombination directionality factor-like